MAQTQQAPRRPAAPAQQQPSQAMAVPKAREVPIAVGPAARLSTPEQLGAAAEKILGQGDLATMSPTQRARYLLYVCQLLGLNPFTRPFEIITFQGQTVLYARKEATEQLARNFGVTTEVKSRRGEEMLGVFLTEVRASYRRADGREVFADALGAVPYVDGQGKMIPVAERANVVKKSECVPLDSEILTRRGWRRYYDVVVGEDVLAYDVASDQTRWTPLLAVNFFGPSPLVRLRSAGGLFDVRCTPDHSWAVRRSSRRRQRPRVRGPYANAGPERALVKTSDLRARHGIVLAGPCADPGVSELTPTEAAVLGWAVTDGTIARRDGRITLYQSKPATLDAVRELVAAVAPGAAETVGSVRTRTFPSGRTYDTQPGHSWSIPRAVSHAITQRAGFHDRSDLPAIAAALDPPARRAMLQAFMLAEGDGKRTFANGDRHILDAFQILCALEGMATGRETVKGPIRTQRLKLTRHAAVQILRREECDPAPVWCPTTAYGTWVMRQDGRVMITGNTQARRRAVLGLLGLGIFDRAGERDPDLAVDARGAIAGRSTRELPASSATTAEIFEDDPPDTYRGGAAVRAEVGAAEEILTPSDEEIAAAAAEVEDPPADRVERIVAAFPEGLSEELRSALASIARRWTEATGGRPLPTPPRESTEAGWSAWHDGVLSLLDAGATNG